VPNSTSETDKDTALTQSIKDLCQIGLYRDALQQAEKYWGSIDTWAGTEKSILAIRIYSNLGGDRKSDALLLKLWRRQKSAPELLHRILFYKLNRSGPILTNEFLHQHESVILEDAKFKADVLGFKSIIQRIFKNYSVGEVLVNVALSVDKSDSWLASLKLQLLADQEELDTAKTLAEKHFDSFPSPYNLRVLSSIVAKFDGIGASILLYQQHASKFQSASVWLEYAQLLAADHNWSECESAIKRFEQTRIIQDKYDQRSLLAYKGQIAIFHQNIDLAIELLSQLDSRYWNIVVENLKKDKGQVSRKVLEVPFLRQEHMTCAPTTLAALSRYWGRHYDSKIIADEICFDGTPETKERQWLRDNGFYFKEFELETDLAYQLIDKHIPFALVTTNGYSAHIQAVIGYNKQVGTLYIMDPSQPVMQEMLTKETIESEAYNGARCLAFVPTEEQDRLSEFDFPASNLYPYWDDFNCAQQSNDFLKAQAALTELKNLDPEHRITLRVERYFAIWNNDTSKILNLNNSLLQQFPNETALLNSKYVCLRDIGKREEGLSLLSDYLERNNNLDLLGTLFNEIYNTNGHNELTDRLLSRMKLIGGYSAHSHWLLANYYWSHQAFEKATEHYLYAYCLDETNSQYIESYFSASRYLKRQQDSLTLLQDRYNKYKIRSTSPAISLFKAYELLDQEHIGLEFLFAALATHPSDKNLIVYLSNKLIDSGLIERFESIQSTIKAQLDQKDFNELLARKNEKLGDFDSALSFFQSSFNDNPFIYKYADGYFGLLSKRGDTAQIDIILQQLYESHETNTQVFDYIADWHSDPFFREKVLTKFVSLRPDYGVIRRQLVDVRFQLGMFEEALSEAKQTCLNIVGELINQSYLAKCYLKIGQFEQARNLTKQVLTSSVDNNLAFTTLMEASMTKEEKEASLEFVFSQIQNQVIFGESAWNFWFEAKSILPQKRLEEFSEYLLNHQQHLWYTYSLCASYFKQYGDLEKAKELLEVGKNKFPLTPRIYHDLGQLCELEGNMAEAIAEYSQALVINPAWSDVTLKLSEVYEREGDTDSAISVIKKSIKHNPNNGVLYGYLADLLMKQGQIVDALQALQNAIGNSTDYRWAWDQFIALSEQQEQAHQPLAVAARLAQQKPYLPHVWRDLAYVTIGQKEKFELYNKSLKCDQYYIPTYLDKSQYFVNKGEYKEALNVLENTPWGNELPVGLSIKKVDLLIQIGQNQLAIDSLKQILFNAHGYSHLWKQLFDLLEQTGNQKDYIDCCHESVKLNRHDANILCYAGENLLKLGNDSHKERAQEYLRKAFNLSSNEQYIVLTYVDSLIDDEKYEEALVALQRHESISRVSYAKTREIGILCKLGRANEAFNNYQSLLTEEDADYWCLNQSFSYLSEYYSFDDLANLYRTQINSLNRQQAFFYTDKCLYLKDNKQYKHVLKELDDYTKEEPWRGAFTALVEFWNEKGITPHKKVIDQYFHRIIETPAIIAQLGNGYVNAEQYQNMIRLFENTKAPEELPAYVYYHYRLALQMLNKWDKAGDVILQGMQQQPDNTLHNMRLWHAYELIRRGQPLTYQDVEVIDYKELIEMEKYVYSTLLVVLKLGDSSLESKMNELNPLLRKCTLDYQQTIGQTLAIHAKNTLKERLKKAAVGEGFFTKLKVSFWLYNRF
jgi:tetratricopeptide (TPR) repeat protein